MRLHCGILQHHPLALWPVELLSQKTKLHLKTINLDGIRLNCYGIFLKKGFEFGVFFTEAYKFSYHAKKYIKSADIFI
jgi:hypothetical protein